MKQVVTHTQHDAALQAARSAYEKYVKAEEGAHKAARKALSKIYEFSVAAIGDNSLVDTYDECKINVREDAAANPFLQPIKLAIGTPELDEANYVSRWLFDSTRLGQFANICFYAHHLGISVEDFRGWLEDAERGGGSITAANQLAQQSGALPGPCRIEDVPPPQDFLSDCISPRWTYASEGDVSIKLNLDKAGLKPGIAQLVVRIEESGTLRVLGAIQMEEAAIVRETKKYLASRPLPHAVLVEASKLSPPPVHIFNGEDGVIFQADGQESFVYSDTPDRFLPIDKTIVLDEAAHDGISLITSNFKDTFWALHKSKLVVSVPGGSAEEALADIKSSRRDKGKKPLKLAGIKLKDGQMELPIKTLDGKAE